MGPPLDSDWKFLLFDRLCLDLHWILVENFCFLIGFDGIFIGSWLRNICFLIGSDGIFIGFWLRNICFLKGPDGILIEFSVDSDEWSDASVAVFLWLGFCDALRWSAHAIAAWSVGLCPWCGILDLALVGCQLSVYIWLLLLACICWTCAGGLWLGESGRLSAGHCCLWWSLCWMAFCRSWGGSLMFWEHMMYSWTFWSSPAFLLASSVPHGAEKSVRAWWPSDCIGFWWFLIRVSLDFDKHPHGIW